MRWDVRAGRAVVLRDPSPLLERLAGPGVPAVLGVEGASVVVAYAPPLSLERLAPRERASVLADVATVLARAHHLGVAHGPLRDEDVRGAVGDVVVDGWRDEGDAAADIASLAQLIERHAGRDPVLQTAAARGLAPVPPSAAGLAAALRPASPAVGRRRTTLTAVGIAAVALAGTTILTGHRAEAQSSPPVVFSGSIVDHDGHQWRATTADDVAGLVCDRPVVLHRATGDVFTLDDWQTPRRVAQHATAIGARACRLLVRDRQGRWRAVG